MERAFDKSHVDRVGLDMTFVNKLRSVSDLIALCNEFSPERFPIVAASFLDFGLRTGEVGQGTFALESKTFPSVIYREQQSLFIGTAGSGQDSADLTWAFPGRAHRFAPDNVCDLVVSAVLDDLTLAWTRGLALEGPERHPDHLYVLWEGQGVSRVELPSWCGIADGRLWFSVPHQGGLFCLG